MTLHEIVRDVYEGLAEPSDLQYESAPDVVDTASAGWKRLVDMVNNACVAIATWKFPNGRRLRFRYLEGNTTLHVAPLSFTVSSGSIGSSVIVTDLTVQALNYYRGWSIRLSDSSIFRVLASATSGTDTQLLLLGSPTTDPTSLTGVISKREYGFVDDTSVTFGNYADGMGYNPVDGKPLEVVQVYDLSQGSELSISKKYDPYIENVVSFGAPSAFYKLSKGLRFDTWPDTTKDYAVWYVRTPKVLGILDEDAEPELPVNFHQAIVLHCLWWGYRRGQENDSSYSTKKDLEDVLYRMSTEYDLQDERTNHQITVNMQGR